MKSIILLMIILLAAFSLLLNGADKPTDRIQRYGVKMRFGKEWRSLADLEMTVKSYAQNRITNFSADRFDLNVWIDNKDTNHYVTFVYSLGPGKPITMIMLNHNGVISGFDTGMGDDGVLDETEMPPDGTKKQPK